jgi:hypothetical protein
MAVIRAARSLLAAHVLTSAALMPRFALADAASRAVEVIATGESRTTRGVEALVRELLKRLPVTVRWVSTPGIDARDVLSRRIADPGLVARVWVDLSDPTGARLFVANPASDRFLVRLVPADEGHEEVEEEAVAQIIGSAVDAILAGGEIGVTREIAARQISIEPLSEGTSHPAVPSFASRNEGPSGRLGAFLGLRALGAGPVVSVDPGLLVAVVGPRRWAVQPFLILELQYEAPFDWQAQAVSLRLEGAGGSLQPGLQTRVGSRLSLQASTGFSTDTMHVQPYAAPGSVFAPRGPFWLTAVVATARVGFEVVVAAPVFVFASVGIDVDLSGVRFNVSDNDSAAPNVVPWRAWPVAHLGVSFGLDGPRVRPP